MSAAKNATLAWRVAQLDRALTSINSTLGKLSAQLDAAERDANADRAQLANAILETRLRIERSERAIIALQTVALR